MTPALLRAAGEALYGSYWQSPLARDLDVSDRTVRRWASGEWPAPRDVGPAIRKLLEKRGKDIAKLLAKV